MSTEQPSQQLLNRLFTYQDGQLIWKHRSDRDSQWNGHYAGTVAGYNDSMKYRRITINHKHYGGHRLIWIMFNGDIPSGLFIDHIDRNPSNNNINNLRLATASQNQFNRMADSGRKFKGVYPIRKKFKAEITFMGKRYYLGLFKTQEDASQVYNDVANFFFSEFAPDAQSVGQ